MSPHVCLHLRPLEDHLTALGHKITASGQVWSMNCRYWVYFDAVLDCEALKTRFKLESCVIVHRNDDLRSGRELGLVCDLDHDAVIGVHPEDAKQLPTVS
jgi:hypothetical protein